MKAGTSSSLDVALLDPLIDELALSTGTTLDMDVVPRGFIPSGGKSVILRGYPSRYQWSR